MKMSKLIKKIVIFFTNFILKNEIKLKLIILKKIAKKR